MSYHSVTVRARFETGHRLPHLPGKCVNLHGHSWNAHITVATRTLDPGDMVMDFSALKKSICDFTDQYLDHGMMLGTADPYAQAFHDEGIKVYRFGTDPHTEGLSWPTVESVAVLLGRVTTDLISLHPHLWLVSAAVSETENNTATYHPQVR